jgi:hypothetical protein
MQQACQFHQPESEISRFLSSLQTWVQAVSLAVSPAVSVSISPGGRWDLNISLSPPQVSPGWFHNLIISPGTTRNSDWNKYPLGLYPFSLNHTFLPNVKSLGVVHSSLSLNHTFLPKMTNHSELSHITQQHKNKQNTQTFALIIFIVNKSKSNQYIKSASFPFGGISYFQQQQQLDCY